MPMAMSGAAWAGPIPARTVCAATPRTATSSARSICPRPPPTCASAARRGTACSSPPAPPSIPFTSTRPAPPEEITMTDTVPVGLGRLKGKVAVVTGASSGIGRATALRFAAEGARLVVNDVDAARLETLRASIAAAGGEVRAVVGDVSKSEDAEAMVDAAVTTFGRLDVMVANAGIIPEMDLLTATAKDFDH